MSDENVMLIHEIRIMSFGDGRPDHVSKQRRWVPIVNIKSFVQAEDLRGWNTCMMAVVGEGKPVRVQGTLFELESRYRRLLLQAVINQMELGGR
jgi:hypothetical protein